MKTETGKTFSFILTSKELKQMYPMDKPQLAQIDCRTVTCVFCKDAGICSNVAPALTLNPDGSFVCWNKKDKPSVVNQPSKKES